MNKQLKEVQYFFYSQAFADGFRASFAILLPALLGSYLGHFDIGLTIALGAMCVSLTDAPGPLPHKRNGMLACTAFIFFVAILTAIARANPYLMGLEIALVTFFFSMFIVYGSRAGGVGNAAILIMILTMDNPIKTSGPLLHASYILAGGLFYTSLSLLLYALRPYRYAQRALGDCIREIATYLSIKADFYNENTNLEMDYKRMVAQQVVVNEKQDAVRELFFKTRQIVKESTDESRKLVFTFVETVDLFEDITAAYYDYRSLRHRFGSSGALNIINASLKKIANELNRAGEAIQSNTSFRKGFDYDEEIKNLKTGIDAVTEKGSSNRLVLRKIIVNIRNLLLDLEAIQQYFKSDIKRKKTGVDHSHFVTHQSLDPKIITDNLTMQSSVFRHAIRVSLACIAGFMVTQILQYGEHSYWILLTIAFILKPAFSLTKQRNIERIIGTFAGGAAGVIILLLIPDKTALFVIMVLFMIGTYSFMRINYLAMVICTTPYVLILFTFLGTEFKIIASERIIDTVIGCAIAFSASYFLFPKWEREDLKTYMDQMVQANAAYLQKIIEALSGKPVSLLDYKIARRDVYLHSANLSALFQRMLSEPKSKQQSVSKVQQFVVLNHILFSNIATVATTLLSSDSKMYADDLLQLAKKAKRKLAGENEVPAPEIRLSPAEMSSIERENELMKEQLQFIYTVSNDIQKLTKKIG